MKTPFTAQSPALIVDVESMAGPSTVEALPDIPVVQKHVPACGHAGLWQQRHPASGRRFRRPHRRKSRAGPHRPEHRSATTASAWREDARTVPSHRISAFEVPDDLELALFLRRGTAD
jgi:hypothetical protein